MKFIIQQRGYYLGGKGYIGAWCRRAGVKPGRLYKELRFALRDAERLTNANDQGYTFVVYPFMTVAERRQQIETTIARLPKNADGKPRFREEGAWNCPACHEEGFILNEQGYFEPCKACDGSGVLAGEWA